MPATKLGTAYVDVRANTTQLATGLVGVQGAFKKSLASALSLERVMNRLAFIGTVGLVYAFGRALQTAFKDGTKDAIEFESAIAHINTVLDASAKQYLPKFRKGIEDISLSLGKDVKDLSASLYDIISARIPPEHALYVLSKATELATANQAELRSVTQAVLTILKAYNMEISETGRITDQLQTAIKFGRMEMTDLAPVLGDVTSAAAILNIRLEDVLGSLATMTRAGFNPKKAVTSMRRAFMAMSEDAELSAKIQKDGFLSVLPIIEAMGQQQQKTITGGIRGFQTYAVAMQNWVAAGEDVKQLMKDEETVAEALGIELESTSLKIKQAGQANEKVWRDVGDQFKKSKIFWITAGTAIGSIVKTMTNFSQMNKEIFGAIAGTYGKASDELLNYEAAYKAFEVTARRTNASIKTGLGIQITKIENLIDTEKKRHALAKKQNSADIIGLTKLITKQKELIKDLEKRNKLGKLKLFEDSLIKAKGELIDFKNELEDLLTIDVDIELRGVEKLASKTKSILALEEIKDPHMYFKDLYKELENMIDNVEYATDFMADRFSNAFDIITDRTMAGGKKLTAIWEGLVDSLIAELNRLLAKMIAVFLFKQLLGLGGVPGMDMGKVQAIANTPVPMPEVLGGGGFSPIINNSVNATFSRRDMGWIYGEGKKFYENTHL